MAGAGSVAGRRLGGRGNRRAGVTKGGPPPLRRPWPAVPATDWIIVSQNQGDTAIPTSWSGENGTCSWCGDNGTGFLMSQIVQVTSVSGNTIGISRPLYYTFTSALTPRIRKFNALGATKAGLEGMKLDGYINRTTRTSAH